MFAPVLIASIICGVYFEVEVKMSFNNNISNHIFYVQVQTGLKLH